MLKLYRLTQRDHFDHFILVHSPRLRHHQYQYCWICKLALLSYTYIFERFLLWTKATNDHNNMVHVFRYIFLCSYFFIIFIFNFTPRFFSRNISGFDNIWIYWYKIFLLICTIYKIMNTLQSLIIFTQYFFKNSLHFLGCMIMTQLFHYSFINSSSK